MREYRFRGKRLSDGKWCEGFLTVVFEHTYIERANEDEICFRFLVDPKTVGQFTGLKDRNCKRIFEGDIFSVTWSAKDRTPVVKTFVAVFKNGCFYARAFNGNQIVATIANYANCRKVGDTGVFVEVIGNIHDNPELLEE